MAISLTKGQNISISREVPGIRNILVGLGWNARATDGDAFDLDASCFMLTEIGKVPSDSNFIFYNNLKSPCGSVEHSGDNRTGEGDGDDEKLIVSLERVPLNIVKLSFGVTIHEAESKRQNFGMVSSAFIRIVNIDTNTEIARLDLSEEASTNTAMLFGELYRYNGEWKFRGVGQGFNGGLQQMAQSFGVSI